LTDEVSQRLEKAARLLAQIGELDPATHGEMLVHHAYYAMFHAASAVILARTGTVPVRHATVVSEFGRLMCDLGGEGRRHGRALNRAHDVRLVADYAIDTRVLPATARETIGAASALVGFCREILAGR
jgi:uncharacterized protein (UPF0332 family)